MQTMRAMLLETIRKLLKLAELCRPAVIHGTAHAPQPGRHAQNDVRYNRYIRTLQFRP